MTPGRRGRSRLVENEEVLDYSSGFSNLGADTGGEVEKQEDTWYNDPTTQEQQAGRRPETSQLTVIEKKFLLCVQRGDVVIVQKLLEQNKENTQLDVNCTDPLGRTALVVAIENESMELIKLLLGYQGTKTGDALLHAISEQYVEAVEVLLQHEERIHQAGQPYSWESVEYKSATYTRDITPLILAAHKDNYEILKLLLDRGASLPSPHDVRCSCDECLTHSQEDCLRHSRSRINAYKALASPSLIVLSSKDPVLTAFDLSGEVRRLSSIENEFMTEYRALQEQLENFASALLDHTRTSHELSVVLNYDPNTSYYPQIEPPGSKMSLERLKLAIKLEQKSFVAHPSVQQLLGSVWYEGMPGFRRKGPLGQMVEIGKLGACFPLYCTAYLLASRSKWGAKIKQPFIKFITHSSSYCFFLFLLILASQRVDVMVVDIFGTESMRRWIKDYQRRERGKLPSVIEIPILFYILGFVWGEIKELWGSGIVNYARDMWNILDGITNFLYVTWIGLRIIAYFQVQRELSKGLKAHMPREHWDHYDPHLISEGMFGAAIIFSVLKMVHIFSVNPHLGPLQISLGRMVFDITKFFFIYTLVVFAFGVGMNQLLWYYAEMDRNICYTVPIKPNPQHDTSCEIWRRFSNMFETSQSLFWASFGLVELYNFELTGIKSYTRFWAMLMFGCYSVINVVVLLNLLIAMMSSSYQIISEHSDTEWKFARSKLWMGYFEEGDTVPPPFNIIPSTKFLFKLKPFQPKKPTNSIKMRQEQSRDAEYASVVRCLVRRYVTTEQRRVDSSPVTEDNVNEVKQDIATFRCELFEILRTNGMKCQNVTLEKDTGGKKEREFERRLLKDFNIGLVQSVVGAVLRGGRNAGVRRGNVSFDVLRRVTGRRVKAQRNWNAIVEAAKQQHNQIGSSEYCSNSGSVVDLREKVLGEQEDSGEPSSPRPRPVKKLVTLLKKACLEEARRRLEAEQENSDSEDPFPEDVPEATKTAGSSHEKIESQNQLTGNHDKTKSNKGTELEEQSLPDELQESLTTAPAAPTANSHEKGTGNNSSTNDIPLVQHEAAEITHSKKVASCSSSPKEAITVSETSRVKEDINLATDPVIQSEIKDPTSTKNSNEDLEIPRNLTKPKEINSAMPTNLQNPTEKTNNLEFNSQSKHTTQDNGVGPSEESTNFEKSEDNNQKEADNTPDMLKNHEQEDNSAKQLKNHDENIDIKKPMNEILAKPLRDLEKLDDQAEATTDNLLDQSHSGNEEHNTNEDLEKTVDTENKNSAGSPMEHNQRKPFDTDATLSGKEVTKSVRFWSGVAEKESESIRSHTDKSKVGHDKNKPEKRGWL